MIYFDFIKKNSKVLFIFLILIFLIYGQTLLGDFVFDDRGIIEHHGELTNTDNLGSIVMHPYWETENGLYRPTTILSYTANLLIFGDDPFSFHLINLALYLFICFFIYLLIKKLWSNPLLAFLISLLFLILPIHTEVVANITGRSELLCLFFGLLAMLEFTKEKINYYLLGLYVFLSIGAKETGIVILPIIGLLIYIKENGLNVEILKKYFTPISATVIGVLFYFFLRFFSLGPSNFLGIKTSLIENPLLFTDTFSRLATALKILSMYFYKTLWPINLCSDYSYNQITIINNFFNLGAILGLSLVSISVFIIFKYINRKPILSLGSLIFLFAFLPTSNILFPIGTIAGERLFFFPSLGISMVIGFLIYKVLLSIKRESWQLFFVVFLFLIISLYGITSARRAQVWTTEEKLFISGKECAPNSVLSRSNSGAMYLIKGDYEKAEQELKASMEIKPIYSKGINNLGLLYFKKGDYEKAREYYLKSLSMEFPYRGALENMVLLYLETKDYNLAKHWMMLTYGLDEKTADSLIEEYKKQK